MAGLRRGSPFLFILVTIFLDVLGYGMVIPLLPYYVRQQAGGAILAGSLGSVYAAVQLVSGPVLGALSDRYGRRPVLLMCLLGTVGAFLLLGLANSLTMVFLAVALDGATGGNLTTAYAYVADVSRPEDRAARLSYAGAALGLGVMAGPAIGGLLSSAGLAVPAFTAAGVALANVVYGFLVLPESLPEEKRLKTPFHLSNPLGGFKRDFLTGRLGRLLAALFTLNLAFGGLQTNFPLFSQDRFGWSSTRTGIFFAFVGVCIVLVQGLLYPRLQRRLGERRLAVGGLVLVVIGLGGTAVAAADWLLFPLVGLAAAGTNLAIPSLTAIASNQVGPERQGRLMGANQLLLSLTMILAPALAGWMYETVGIPAPYALGSGLALAALMIAWNKSTGSSLISVD